MPCPLFIISGLVRDISVLKAITTSGLPNLYNYLLQMNHCFFNSLTEMNFQFELLERTSMCHCV